MTDVTRTQIRKAFCEALLDVSALGARIYDSRVDPMDAPSIPGAVVLIRKESATRLTHRGQTGTRMGRSVTVEVQLHVKQSQHYAKAMDDLVAAVEMAVITNSALSALVMDMRFDNVEFLLGGESEKPTAVAMMEFSVMYHTLDREPATLLN